MMRRILLTLLRAACAALAALAFNGMFGVLHWFTAGAYPLIGCAIAAAGWTGDRVWHAAASHKLRRSQAGPESGPGPGGAATLSKVPFWFLSGGAGYVIGLLAS